MNIFKVGKSRTDIFAKSTNDFKIEENIDYGDTDLRSIIEGDRSYRNGDKESYESYGFTKQEFKGDELVDVEEDDMDTMDDDDDLTDL